MDVTDEYYNDGYHTNSKQVYSYMDTTEKFNINVNIEYKNIMENSITASSERNLSNSLLDNIQKIDISLYMPNPVGCILGFLCINPVTKKINKIKLDKLYNELKSFYPITKEFIVKYARFWLSNVN